MYRVETDHQVVAFGHDRLALLNNADGATIATAVEDGGTWTVTADGADPVTADSTMGAVDALTAMALTVLGGAGYSTLVPHGITNPE